MNPKYQNYIDSLTVYECKNKYRLGNKNDGGYVIMETDGYDLLLSGGVGGDIGFEKAFTDKYKTKCYCFDGTEESGFELTKNEPNITYINKNIGPRVTQNTVNFDFGFKKHIISERGHIENIDIFDLNENLILGKEFKVGKFNIENTEYDIINPIEYSNLIIKHDVNLNNINNDPENIDNKIATFELKNDILRETYFKYFR